MPRSYLFALMVAAAIAWLILLWLNGIPVPAVAFLKPFSAVEALLLTLIGIFDRWAWRWRIFRPWLVSTPDLNGTWQGRLQSTWIAPGEETPRPAIDVYMAVRQTFSSIYIRLMSGESESVSLSAAFIREPDGRCGLSVTYRNTPTVLLRPESAIHYGGMLLTVRSAGRVTLDGEYWTSRRTMGDLRFAARARPVCDSFAEAARAPEFQRS